MSGKRQNGVDLDQALERPPTAQAGSKRVVAEEDVPKADVDMIDLTMSSDDEAPAPAPKRQATAQVQLPAVPVLAQVWPPPSPALAVVEGSTLSVNCPGVLVCRSVRHGCRRG